MFLTMLALPVLYLLFGEGPEQLEACLQRLPTTWATVLYCSATSE